MHCLCVLCLQRSRFGRHGHNLGHTKDDWYEGGSRDSSSSITIDCKTDSSEVTMVGYVLSVQNLNRILHSLERSCLGNLEQLVHGIQHGLMTAGMTQLRTTDEEITKKTHGQES